MGQEQSGEYDPTTDNADPSVEPGAGADVDDDDDEKPVTITSDTDLQTLSAYRVMKVFQGSPASRSGLTPFEDFIVAVNAHPVTADNASLGSVLTAHEGATVDLLLYNVVDAVRRNVALRPVKWNGPGLLGAAVRYEPVAGAVEHIHRVIDVLEGSPASEAGLVPSTDYIVGTPAEVFRTDAHFTKLIHSAIDRSEAASVMVYSTTTGRTRDVEIRPDPNWGGEGSLGCELATGLLHQITRPS